MFKCPSCGAVNTREVKLESKYLYEHSGIPVELHNAVTNIKCNKCQHVAQAVQNLGGLSAALALVRIQSPVKLNGKEISFIRKTIGLRSTEMAKELDVNPESFSRWENGHQPIGDKNEKFLRLIAAVKLESKAPAMSVDINNLMNMTITPMRIKNEIIALELVKLKDKKTTEKNKEWDVCIEEPRELMVI